MATAQQIRQTAAENLGILGEGETMPSYETADLNQAYVEVYAELEALDLAAWDYANNVPDRFAHSVSMLVAESRAVKYQVPNDRYERIKLEAQAAMNKIRKLQTRSKFTQTEIENY